MNKRNCILLIMLMLINLCNIVHGETDASLKSAILAGDQLVLTMDNVIDSANIRVVDEHKQEMANVNYSISGSRIYVKVPCELQKQNSLVILNNKYLISGLREDTVTSNFDTVDDCQRWVSILDLGTGSRTGYIRSNNAGGAFLADNASNVNTGSFNRVNRASDVYLKNYVDYLNFQDSELAFDYSNPDTTTTGGNAAVVLRAFFRADKISVDISSNPVVSSKNGAYALEIYKKGKGIHLARWNGTANRFTDLSAKTNVTTFIDNDSLIYNSGDIYRYVILTTNVENGVNIVVKRAKYINSILGEYETVFDYTDLATDTNTPLYNGSFWMSARTSDTINFNAHVIDNVSFSNNKQEIIDIEQYKADFEQSAKEFIGVTVLNNSKYDTLINLSERANLLMFVYNENELQGYENVKMLLAKIPQINTVRYTNNVSTHQIDVTTSLPIKKGSMNKDNVTVQKNGKAFDDFEVTADNDASENFSIRLFNDRYYNSKFVVSISKNIATQEGNIMIDDYSYSLNETPQVILGDIMVSDNNNGTVTATLIAENKSESAATVSVLLNAVIEYEYNGTAFEKQIASSQITDTIGSESSKPISMTFEKPVENFKCNAVVVKDFNTMLQLYKTVNSNNGGI